MNAKADFCEVNMFINEHKCATKKSSSNPLILFLAFLFIPAARVERSWPTVLKIYIFKQPGSVP